VENIDMFGDTRFENSAISEESAFDIEEAPVTIFLSPNSLYGADCNSRKFFGSKTKKPVVP
jgi:hypothetical protein